LKLCRLRDKVEKFCRAGQTTDGNMAYGKLLFRKRCVVMYNHDCNCEHLGLETNPSKGRDHSPCFET